MGALPERRHQLLGDPVVRGAEHRQPVARPREREVVERRPAAARTGTEYVNFAFITTSGTPQPGSPPNPVQATANTFTPNPAADLFMNSGDQLIVTMHDTASGLRDPHQRLDQPS